MATPPAVRGCRRAPPVQPPPNGLQDANCPPDPRTRCIARRIFQTCPGDVLDRLVGHDEAPRRQRDPHGIAAGRVLIISGGVTPVWTSHIHTEMWLRETLAFIRDVVKDACRRSAAPAQIRRGMIRYGDAQEIGEWRSAQSCSASIGDRPILRHDPDESRFMPALRRLVGLSGIRRPVSQCSKLLGRVLHRLSSAAGARRRRACWGQQTVHRQSRSRSVLDGHYRRAARSRFHAA